MLQTVQPELRWNTSPSPSAIHCAVAVLAGRTLPEPSLHQLMMPAAASLQSLLQTISVKHPGAAPRFLERLLMESSRIGGNVELAEFALRKSFGLGQTDTLKNQVTRFISEAERAFDQQYPSWREMMGMLLHSHKFRWQLHGQKLLRGCACLTTEALVPGAAEFTTLYSAGLVRPYVDVLSNTVLFEFIEDQDDLTAAMQLVWLTLMLNLELDHLHGGMQRDIAVETGRIALIPVVLASAAADGLMEFSPQNLNHLITTWNVALSQQQQEQLLRWWDVYYDRRPSWATAMMGLNQLLSNPENAGSK